MTIDKSLYELPRAKKNKKKLLASETGSEEAQMELDQLLQQFDDWKKENSGGWRDFLKSNKDLKAWFKKQGVDLKLHNYSPSDFLD